MPAEHRPRQVITRELGLFAALLFLGVTVLPLAIYVIGRSVFGEYGGGFGTFYRTLHSELRSGNPAILFLLLSPYIVWQLLRVTLVGFRLAARNGSARAP